jgi:hypothetical protein
MRQWKGAAQRKPTTMTVDPAALVVVTGGRKPSQESPQRNTTKEKREASPVLCMAGLLSKEPTAAFTSMQRDVR